MPTLDAALLSIISTVAHMVATWSHIHHVGIVVGCGTWPKLDGSFHPQGCTVQFSNNQGQLIWIQETGFLI